MKKQEAVTEEEMEKLIYHLLEADKDAELAQYARHPYGRVCGLVRQDLWSQVKVALKEKYGEGVPAGGRAESLFDRVRPRMRREGKICYDRSRYWHLDSLREGRARLEQESERKDAKRQALARLQQDAGMCVVHQRSNDWMSSAGAVRERYLAVAAMTPEEFELRGVPSDLELLAGSTRT